MLFFFKELDIINSKCIFSFCWSRNENNTGDNYCLKVFFSYLEENKQVDDFMSDNLFKNVKFRYEEVFSPLFFESWVHGWNVNKREVSVDIRDEILIKYYRGTQVVRKLQIEKTLLLVVRYCR